MVYHAREFYFYETTKHPIDFRAGSDHLQPKNDTRNTIDDRPAGQLKFLKMISSARDSILSPDIDQIKKTAILNTIDAYVVDSLRQFKGWYFTVENINETPVNKIPSYVVDLSCRLSPDESGKQRKPGNINFSFVLPKNPSEKDLVILKNQTEKLKSGQEILLDGVIFMTDPSMTIITLKDYFDHPVSKSLTLIPVKINNR